MEGDEDRPEIIECEIRLHSGPPGAPDDAPWDFAAWSATAVTAPVTFAALAVVSRGAWNGPLAPGAPIAAPVALQAPWWTVFLPAAHGVPIAAGPVGHALGIGETFTLAPGEPDRWAEGTVFDGAVVIR